MPRPAEREREPRITIEWHGADGSVWDLRKGPVRATQAGIRGFGMPIIKRHVSQSALVHGQRSTGYKVEAREAFLPLKFTTTDVVATQRAWWRSVRPGEPGTLIVSDGLGGVRSLVCEYGDEGAMTYELDPHVMPNKFGLTMIADEPLWRGDEVVHEFEEKAAVRPGFGQAEGDPVLWISSSYANAGDAQIANPGDVDAWPAWVIRGTDPAGVQGFRFELDGNLIAGDVAVAYDQTLTINTDPEEQTAMLTGPGVTGTGNVTRQLDAVEFAQVPPGRTATARVQLTGVGRAEIRTRPLYFRAF